MPKNLFLLLPLLTLATLFIMGARRGPHFDTPWTAETAFVPGSIGADVPADGDALLARAAAQLAPDRVAWLRTKVWQKMVAPGAAFEADGTLTLGPNGCARLELTVGSRSGSSNVLVVSDGAVIAQVTQLAGDPPMVLSVPLPTDEGRMEALREKGCAGPGPMLAEMRKKLCHIKVETGRLDERPVIQVSGEVDGDRVMNGTVYLDAGTLWPHRVEWHDTRGRPVLQIEYRDPVLNQPLSLDECARLFSYQPDGDNWTDASNASYRRP